MQGITITLSAINKKRKQLLLTMALAFIALLAASLFVSGNFGYFLFACLSLGMLIAPFLGRYWCNWLCPRGSFLEAFLGKFTLRRQFPQLFKNSLFLTLVAAIFMAMMGVNFYLLSASQTGFSALGIALTRLLVASTVVAIILGIIYEPRVWCVFCPGATFAKLAAFFGNKKPYLVNAGELCTSCQVCVAACPFHIDASKNGIIHDADCLKCFACVERCPTKALAFSDRT